MSAGCGARMPTRSAAKPLPDAVAHLNASGTGTPARQSMVAVASTLPYPKNSSLRGSSMSGSSTSVVMPSPLSAAIETGPVVTTPIVWGPSVSGTNDPSTRAEKARGSMPSGVDPKNRTRVVDDGISNTVGASQSVPLTYDTVRPGSPSGVRSCPLRTIGVSRSIDTPGSWTMVAFVAVPGPIRSVMAASNVR